MNHVWNVVIIIAERMLKIAVYKFAVFFTENLYAIALHYSP